MSITSETALYAPVKQFLEAQGYEVRGEVRGCDLVAVRGEDLVAVELKPSMNLTLVLQGLERLKVTGTVYLAIQAPSRGRPSRWHEVQQLCHRLGLGLMTVRFTTRGPRVEVICDPGPYVPRRAIGQRRLLLGEFQQRSADHNTGGSSRRPIVTAYREEALCLAGLLRREGPSTVKYLRETAGSPKAANILGEDFYGWFSRVRRGVYQLTPQGAEALELYADVIRAWAGSAPPARHEDGQARHGPGG